MAPALVIGGGLSGLGAALFLSKIGRKVVLVEKSDRPAPLVRGFQRRGLTYETGFHYAGGLHEGGVVHRYLERLGLFETGLTTRPLPDPGGEHLRFPESGEDFALPRGFDDFRRLFPGISEVDDFFSHCRAVFNRSPYLNREIAEFEPMAFYNQGDTLASRLDRLEVSARQKTLLGFRCLLYGARPSEACFDQFALVNTPYLGGAHTFEGGGGALVKAFESALAKAGVTVLTGHEVVAIKTDRHNVSVAALCETADGRGEELAFDDCVYTGSPAALPRLLPEGALRPVLRRRLAGLKYSPSPLLFFGRTRSNRLENRQVFICPDELENWFNPALGAVYVSGGPGRDGYWPVSAVTLLPDGATAPWRGAGPKKDPAYHAFKERLAGGVRENLLANCPELDGDLEIVESATDLTLNRYSLAFGPGIYGKLHSVGEAPILPVTRVGRLALAGQNIVMPGLLGVLVSAALAAGVLAGHETVLEALK